MHVERHSVICALAVVAVALAAVADVEANFAGTDVFIPSLGSGPGAASSNWDACIWVHNPNGAPVNVTLQLLLRNQPNPSPQAFHDAIPAGDTRRYDQALATLFGVTTTAFGAVRVSSPPGQPVLVNARSYSTPAGGNADDTVGQFYSAIPASFAIAAGQTAQLLGVYQTTPQDASPFRYNFGFVETGGGQATVQVTALDETGASVATKSYALGGYEARQYNITDLLPQVNATNVRLEVSVTSGSGRVVAFGSGIANHSNDPSTFEMSFRPELLGGETGIAAVQHDASLQGDGTAASVLGLATGGVQGAHLASGAVTNAKIGDGGVTKAKLAASGGTSGQVLGTNGTSLSWQDASSLALPYSGTASSGNPLFVVANSGSGGAARFTSNNGPAAFALSTGAQASGLYAEADGNNGIGVSAFAQYGTGSMGLYGASAQGTGAYGLGKTGVRGVGAGANAYGVRASADATGIGVQGDSPSGYGVVGISPSQYGVKGDGGNIGVYAHNSVAHGHDVYLATQALAIDAYGDVNVRGNLAKSSGSFKIDHPLDPENKYLSHSFVESPDMMNIYNGNVVTDADGRAVVDLPAWFGALNSDFRYQLTVIGRFAQAIVEQEVESNRFVIRTSLGGVKVSWQVTGIRKDPYAQEHRIRVEEDKPEGERGFYVHPELYGQPAERSIQWARHPETPRRPEAAPGGAAGTTR
jgi:hypothetical protein